MKKSNNIKFRNARLISDTPAAQNSLTSVLNSILHYTSTCHDILHYISFFNDTN